MKFAFIGVHGSGKTGLADKLYNDLVDTGQCPCLIGNVASILKDEEKIFLAQGTNIESQIRILQKQISEEIRIASSLEYKHIICDGAPLSHYAYFIHVIKKNQKNQDRKDIENSDIFWYNLDKIVETWMNSYNYIFKLDPRKDCDDFPKEVDAEINKLLKKFNLKHIILYDEHRSNWYDTVKRTIELGASRSYSGKDGDKG